MFTVARLRKKPRHFHSFTGLTPDQFDQLLFALRPAYEQAEEKRLARPDRKRAIGAGHQFTLALPERLLMGLMHWRLYVTQSLLAYLFGLDESGVSREITQRLRPRLLDVLPTPMRDSFLLTASGGAGKGADGKGADGKGADGKGADGKPHKRIGTLAELLAAHPELEEVFADATEQPVPKPKTKTNQGQPKPIGQAARKQRYSGKQKCHTVKTQALTSKHLVLHVLGNLPGSVHDYTLLRASGVLHHLLPGLPVRVDKGYEGVQDEYPDVTVEKPVRGQRGHRVTALGQAYNRAVSRLRVPVEHVFARLKQFRVLSGVYRGQWKAHEDTFCLVSGLINFKALGRLAWA